MSDPLSRIKALADLKPSPNAVMILSSDRVRTERCIDKVNEVLKLEDVKCKRIKIDTCTDKELQKLAFSSQELSLFSSKQYFLIENIDKITASKTEILLDLFSKQNTDVFFFVVGKQLRANSKLYKQFKSSNCLIELKEFKPNELLLWIKRELSMRKIAFKGAVPEMLAEMSESADQAVSYIEIIQNYANQETIETLDLEQLFPSQISANEFQWLDLIKRGEIVSAELMLINMLKSGKHALPLLGLMHSTYQSYFLIALLKSKGLGQGEIRQQLGMAPWLFNKRWKASNESTVQLKIKLEKILKSDLCLKGKSLGEENTFSQLIKDLAA